MSCSMHQCSKRDQFIDLKVGQIIGKTLTMTDRENCTFLSKGVAVRGCEILVARHEHKSCCNLNIIGQN